MAAQGRATFEARGPARTLITMTTEIEEMDDSEKLDFLTSMMRRSVNNVRYLIESEIVPTEE